MRPQPFGPTDIWMDGERLDFTQNCSPDNRPTSSTMLVAFDKFHTILVDRSAREPTERSLNSIVNQCALGLIEVSHIYLKKSQIFEYSF